MAGLKERSEAAPIIDLVDLVVKSAIKSKASDVHVEPMEKGVLIRHRLDGLLKEVMDLPKWVHEGLIARLKIMAGMDIAEKRLPQDGRLRSTAEDGSEVDFRVSTLRTLFGEKVVMRVLDHRKGVPALEEIGMSATALEEVRGFLRHQHGMILVVGPTGSGKTTTLSSALKAVVSEKTNIITIEDPVEYQIPGVNQTQINDKIKLTFASALRSILRQDPDVILLGEIRDGETAKIAMQAAQTGHLVLSTLHTDDAPSVVTRLADIGAEPFVIASALVGVIAQRLVRRLCVHCRRQYTPPADVLRSLGIADVDAAAIPFYKSVGCDQCNHTGYRGRIGIYEVMRVTDKLRRLIAARTTRRSDPRGGRRRRHDHARGRWAVEGEERRDDSRGVAARGHRGARDAHAVRRVWCGRRRRLQRLPAMRQAPGRRLSALRPGAAAGLEFLPVLRENDDGSQESAQTAQGSRQRGSHAARAAGRQYCGVQEIGGAEKLLRASRDRRRARRLRRSRKHSVCRSRGTIPTRCSISGRNFRAWRRTAPPSSPKPTGFSPTQAAAPSTTARSRTQAGCRRPPPRRRSRPSRPPTRSHQPTRPRRRPPPPPTSTDRQTGPQFKQERASRDEFVRKATMSRLRQALAAVGGGYDESEVSGFDLACVPKKKLFASNKNPRLLGRFISRLDREAVADAWKEAAKWGVAAGEEVCVLLMGTSLAPAGELAGEIADQRKRQPRKGGKLTLIPVDARVWDAHMPFDAPAIAKTLLARLRTGS